MSETTTVWRNRSGKCRKRRQYVGSGPGSVGNDDSIEESGREALGSVGNDDSIEESGREALGSVGNDDSIERAHNNTTIHIHKYIFNIYIYIYIYHQA